ncbi:MAG TPA: alpha-L-rhamnosidase C-terminal domain-containing protein [Armatimonadota bacterium]|nr:alpha-L-rhamnosidase C-terminal domain-containing protein [Armatimonadota bacterium]
MPRVYVLDDPFADPTRAYWARRGDWRAQWVDDPRRPLGAPSVALYRLRFALPAAAVARIHVTADNRYRLFLDGGQVGRGPERGDPRHWRFESYDLELTAGEHVLVAQSWWLGHGAPYAQTFVRPGFLLAADEPWHDALATGVAPWETLLMDGIEFLPPGVAWGAGLKARVVGDRFPWDWHLGETEGAWAPAVPLVQGMAEAVKNEIPPFWTLTPATLPPMLEAPARAGVARHVDDGAPERIAAANNLAGEQEAWRALLAGAAPVTIPPHTTRRVIIDLEDYYCAYPQLTVSGGRGATIGLQWAEALYEVPETEQKGHRDEIEGKLFTGVGDEFLPDGGARRRFTTLWWEAGRYLELRVTTADAPLTIDALTLVETRYPLEDEGRFQASDPRLEAVIPIGVRALQMCSHETYMDCPYYEQLMYIGDTRLEALTTYALTNDDRLPRKALACFDHSRRLSGLTQSRYPCHTVQIIPPFSLWFVCMVHDYWLWRGDPDFTRERLPGVRAVLEAFRTWLRADGLLDAPNGPAGWNFADWVPEWPVGIPPDAECFPSGLLNMQYALTLGLAAALEDDFGEPLLAERNRETARRVMDATLEHCWHAGRGLLADNLAKDRFSEHTQCLALLSGLLPAERRAAVADGLLDAPDLSRTTIYFSHYLFETYTLLGRADRLLERLALWFDLAPRGFKTTFESPEPCRSDCHAWGAHPIFHYHASLLGIRPAAPGFQRVRVAPQLGGLAWARGAMPHPAGAISADVRAAGDGVRATLTLPDGISGEFVWHGQAHPLTPGENRVAL